jgi:hypothetical protein
MAIKTWEEIKQGGSEHYKLGGIEPIDLYLSLGALRAFAICSIIKYASRNMGIGEEADPVSNKDMDKIIHYAEMLKTSCGTKEV